MLDHWEIQDGVPGFTNISTLSGHYPGSTENGVLLSFSHMTINQVAKSAEARGSPAGV